jgi:uncharacterized Zn-binding protein involved in type VI secretion
MKRHHITLGASTTTGGKVITASGIMRIHNLSIALDGDTIACLACKSIGRIVCIGPRNTETINGKAVALEKDLCVCKCRIPPRLIANQTLRYQALEGSAMPPLSEPPKEPALIVKDCPSLLSHAASSQSGAATLN